jgi:glycosyltransferase involved in cell wall biosynthesis
MSLTTIAQPANTQAVVASVTLPSLTVVIPAYNHGHYVRETLESLWAQDYPLLDIIVIDDVSSDNTLAVLQGLAHQSPCPMQVLQNKRNQGVSKTCKAGAQLATGDLLLFMASDDKLAPDSLRAMAQAFTDNPALVVCFGNGHQFDATGVEDTPFYRPETVALLRQSPQAILAYLQTHVSPFFVQSTLIKRSFYHTVGGHDTRCVIDDWVLNLRLFAQLQHATQFSFSNIPFCLRRLHDTNIHKNQSRHWAGIQQVYQRYTPPKHRNLVLATMCWTFAKQALKQRNKALALGYALKSLRYQFKPLVVLKFIRKQVLQ